MHIKPWFIYAEHVWDPEVMTTVVAPTPDSAKISVDIVMSTK